MRKIGKIIVILLYFDMVIFLIYPLFLKKMWNADKLDEKSIKKLKKILYVWLGLVAIAVVLLGIIVILEMN